MLKWGKPLKRSPMKRKPKKDKRSAEEKAFYAWLATQPAMDTGGPCQERHHVRHHRFGACMGKKPADWFAVPLSAEGHRMCHAGPNESLEWLIECIETLWQRYGIDLIPQEVQAKLVR